MLFCCLLVVLDRNIRSEQSQFNSTVFMLMYNFYVVFCLSLRTIQHRYFFSPFTEFILFSSSPSFFNLIHFFFTLFIVKSRSLKNPTRKRMGRYTFSLFVLKSRIFPSSFQTSLFSCVFCKHELWEEAQETKLKKLKKPNDSVTIFSELLVTSFDELFVIFFL
jgi:hypothetical protein